MKAFAWAHYLEGMGLLAIERLMGVSHVAVMNWVLEAVEGQVIRLIGMKEENLHAR